MARRAPPAKRLRLSSWARERRIRSAASESVAAPRHCHAGVPVSVRVTRGRVRPDAGVGGRLRGSDDPAKGWNIGPGTLTRMKPCRLEPGG